MSKEKTVRGFQFISLFDAVGEQYTVQQSSAIGDTPDALDRPGSSMLWLGVDGFPRMHLRRDQVVDLIEILQGWVDTGNLYDETSE